jgi:hypothetical protein
MPTQILGKHQDNSKARFQSLPLLSFGDQLGLVSNSALLGVREKQMKERIATKVHFKLPSLFTDHWCFGEWQG